MKFIFRVSKQNASCSKGFAVRSKHCAVCIKRFANRSNSNAMYNTLAQFVATFELCVAIVLRHIVVSMKCIAIFT